VRATKKPTGGQRWEGGRSGARLRGGNSVEKRWEGFERSDFIRRPLFVTVFLNKNVSRISAPPVVTAPFPVHPVIPCARTLPCPLRGIPPRRSSWPGTTATLLGSDGMCVGAKWLYGLVGYFVLRIGRWCQWCSLILMIGTMFGATVRVIPRQSEGFDLLRYNLLGFPYLEK
jgi:hypothetical protein